MKKAHTTIEKNQQNRQGKKTKDLTLENLRTYKQDKRVILDINHNNVQRP